MSEKRRRVVITGVGLICPLGSSKRELWEALTTRRSGVCLLDQTVSDGLPLRFAAPARQFRDDDVECFGPLDKERKKAIRKGIKLMCRESQMGVAAAQLALADAALDQASVDPERIGVSFGSDYMLSVPQEFIEGVRQCLDCQGRFDFSRWGTEGMSKMTPLWLLKYLPNMPASHIAIYNDLRGPNNSLTHREASANMCVGEAAQIIIRGSADVMLAGATGTRLHPMKTIHAMQQEELADGDGDPAAASRPFDLYRTGMVLGEGAAAVVLEELGHAQARNARIYGEVLSSASSAVIRRKMAAHRDRAFQRVLIGVLRAAGLRPEDIGHIHAHGLSTRSCDAAEAQAIARVFAGRSEPVPVVAAKSYFGNLGAGSGMVELIASLLALEEGRLFPILNYTTADPECPIAAVTDSSTPAGDNFINLSVTPQAQASAVLIGRV